MSIKKWMLNKNDFSDEFWERVGDAEQNGIRTTRKDVFNEMNEECFQETGDYRYSSYSSFRVVRDRK